MRHLQGAAEQNLIPPWGHLTQALPDHEEISDGNEEYYSTVRRCIRGRQAFMSSSLPAGKSWNCGPWLRHFLQVRVGILGRGFITSCRQELEL
jgi:hypothetical protein